MEDAPGGRQDALACSRCGSKDLEDRTPDDMPRLIRHYRCRSCEHQFLSETRPPT